MNNNFKHLSSKERHKIYGLLGKKSFKQIAKEINRSPSTVSREVRAHMQLKRKGSKWIHYFNDCKFRKTCTKVYICDNFKWSKIKRIIKVKKPKASIQNSPIFYQFIQAKVSSYLKLISCKIKSHIYF